MPRSTEEWIGKTDDTAVPPRVRLRVFLRFAGLCQECGIQIRGSKWICDHRIALINGGENRENNLGPICETCNKWKTGQDVKQKFKTYKSLLKRHGLKKTKGRPLSGTKASGIRKRMNGRVERW